MLAGTLWPEPVDDLRGGDACVFGDGGDRIAAGVVAE